MIAVSSSGNLVPMVIVGRHLAPHSHPGIWSFACPNFWGHARQWVVWVMSCVQFSLVFWTPGEIVCSLLNWDLLTELKGPTYSIGKGQRIAAISVINHDIYPKRGPLKVLAQMIIWVSRTWILDYERQPVVESIFHIPGSTVGHAR